MPNKYAKTHRIFSWVITALVIALGIALVLSVLDIYRNDPTGDPYSPETIGAHFRQIALLVYATVAAIVGGVLFNLLNPTAPEKPRALRDAKAIMEKTCTKVSFLNPAEMSMIKKEISRRERIIMNCMFAFALLLVYPVFYAFAVHNFHAPNPTTEVIKTTLIVFGPSVLGLVISHLGANKITKSYERQTEIYKQAIKDGRKGTPESKADSNTKLTVLRCSIFAVALILIVLGIANGTAEDVLTKAAAICTECIGLG